MRRDREREGALRAAVDRVLAREFDRVELEFGQFKEDGHLRGRRRVAGRQRVRQREQLRRPKS